ncbi:hypothetical protein FACS1894186_0980 [Alphaproteobacteria bacterium]|nr:hypothetical protein FACS1894186_0980 [Alphaproteobacteria bacterium]
MGQRDSPTSAHREPGTPSVRASAGGRLSWARRAPALARRESGANLSARAAARAELDGELSGDMVIRGHLFLLEGGRSARHCARGETGAGRPTLGRQPLAARAQGFAWGL